MILNEESLLKAITNFDRIKRIETVNRIFSEIKGYLTEKNYKKCFYMLLKKTTYKDLKIHFGHLIINHLNDNNISHCNSLLEHINRIKEKSKQIKHKKLSAKGKKINKTKKNRIENTISNAYGKPGNYGRLIYGLPRS